jgi:hypothetical protein
MKHKGNLLNMFGNQFLNLHAKSGTQRGLLDRVVDPLLKTQQEKSRLI